MKYRFVGNRIVKYWFRFVRRPWFDKDIPVNILFIYKTSSRRLQCMSSIRLQDVFSVTVFCLPRGLQDVLKTSHKTSWRRLRRRKIITLKTCWRRVEDVLEDKKLLGWRRVEDAFKICFEDVFKKSWSPANVSWDVALKFFSFLLNDCILNYA